MSPIVFTAAGGARVQVDPERIESVRPGPQGVLVRFMDGVSQLVQEPYARVLELLAGA